MLLSFVNLKKINFGTYNNILCVRFVILTSVKIFVILTDGLRSTLNTKVKKKTSYWKSLASSSISTSYNIWSPLLVLAIRDPSLSPRAYALPSLEMSKVNTSEGSLML
jgi:hypothetical protein